MSTSKMDTNEETVYWIGELFTGEKEVDIIPLSSVAKYLNNITTLLLFSTLQHRVTGLVSFVSRFRRYIS